MVFSMRNDGLIYDPSFSNINFPSFFNLDFVLGCDDRTYKPSYGRELSLLTNLIFRLNPTWARFFGKSSRTVLKKHAVSQKVFVHFTWYFVHILYWQYGKIFDKKIEKCHFCHNLMTSSWKSCVDRFKVY